MHLRKPCTWVANESVVHRYGGEHHFLLLNLSFTPDSSEYFSCCINLNVWYCCVTLPVVFYAVHVRHETPDISIVLKRPLCDEPLLYTWCRTVPLLLYSVNALSALPCPLIISWPTLYCYPCLFACWIALSCLSYSRRSVQYPPHLQLPDPV